MRTPLSLLLLLPTLQPPQGLSQRTLRFSRTVPQGPLLRRETLRRSLGLSQRTLRLSRTVPQGPLLRRETLRRSFSLLLLLPTLAANAQTNAAPSWLESTLYGSGKINVVVAVVAVIILGIGLWLWRMDRRITKLERKP